MKHRYGHGHAAYQLDEFLNSGLPCAMVEYLPERSANIVATCLRIEIKKRRSNTKVIVRGCDVILLNPNITKTICIK